MLYKYHIKIVHIKLALLVVARMEREKYCMTISSVANDIERLIYTTCSGKMQLSDFDEYIANIWGDNRYTGYAELFDTTDGDWSDFDFANLFAVAANSSKASALTPDMKFAWVVDEDRAKELTDYYKTVKSVQSAKSRQLQAFDTKEEALGWLKS